MYTKQGIQHILAALQFGHSSNDLMGKLIRGSTEALIMELGMHGAGQGAADAALRYIALSNSLIDAYHSHF